MRGTELEGKERCWVRHLLIAFARRTRSVLIRYRLGEAVFEQIRCDLASKEDSPRTKRVFALVPSIAGVEHVIANASTREELTSVKTRGLRTMMAA